MIRPRHITLLLVAALALAGCDRTNSLAVTPELEEETSFEQGLDGWVVGTPAGSTGSGAITTGEASSGAAYLRLELAQGSDVVWVERVFTLDPNTAYSVTISADLRAFTGAADVQTWAGGVPPTGAGFVSQGAVPSQWTRTLDPRPLTTDAQGRAWVALGVSGTGEAGPAGAGAFGVDDLGAVFLRTGS